MSLQETIIQELGVKPVIDAQEEIRRSIDFLKRYLKKHPFLKTFVLGISGGQDSTLAGRLAQLAMEELRAETGDDNYKFIAVRLPYGVQADEADAQKALAFIQPDVSLVVNIKESADAMTAAVEATGSPVSDFNKGNIKARCRMIAQYALAGAHSGAVIGTDHAAENITGFFTKFGDGGADILPLYRLNKRQGKQLLQAPLNFHCHSDDWLSATAIRDRTGHFDLCKSRHHHLTMSARPPPQPASRPQPNRETTQTATMRRPHRMARPRQSHR